MADVKFMDLSQNDNPATTDSVLIGNSTDGLKRTSVGALSNLFSVNGLFHFEKVTAQNDLTGSNAGYVVIGAPDVPGYTFAFWLAPLILDDSTTINMDNPINKTPALYLSGAHINTIVQKFSVIAVYVNSKVA